MTTTEMTERSVRPHEVHERLAKHILADGLNIVMDLERSQGARLFDSLRGRGMLDMFGCFSTVPLGYNHPKMMQPAFQRRLMTAAVNKPSNSDLYSIEMAEFVEAFARTLPPALQRHTFYIEGGAMAVENALKTAFDWKRRMNDRAGRPQRGEQIIHFEQAFHGRSGYTLGLTNTADPRKTQYFPQFDWPRIQNPHLMFPLTDEETERVEGAERAAVEQIQQAIATHGHDIAGLIIEPIQGEGGDNHFRTEFFAALRQLADENEFLLLFDEVQTGFATTGAWWCFEHFGVEPDVLAFGKKTQVCGIAANSRIDEIDSVFEVSSRINSTWGGNLVDMIRCQRIIEIIEEDDLLSHATRIGGELLEGMRRWEGAHPNLVSNARGRGMFAAFDLPTTEQRDKLLALMADDDVLGLPSGHRAVRFRPHVNLTSEDATDAQSRVERALDRL